MYIFNFILTNWWLLWTDTNKCNLLLPILSFVQHKLQNFNFEYTFLILISPKNSILTRYALKIINHFFSKPIKILKFQFHSFDFGIGFELCCGRVCQQTALTVDTTGEKINLKSFVVTHVVQRFHVVVLEYSQSIWNSIIHV